jgi:hypothetical protein
MPCEHPAATMALPSNTVALRPIGFSLPLSSEEIGA